MEASETLGHRLGQGRGGSKSGNPCFIFVTAHLFSSTFFHSGLLMDDVEYSGVSVSPTGVHAQYAPSILLWHGRGGKYTSVM